MTTAIVPRVSGGEEEHGHLEEFRTDPIGLMQRVRDECGDVGIFQLAGKHVVFLSGAEANEFFFRSSDEDLDQAAAYPFMTPIFGQGVVFDTDPERRKEMLHNAALRGEQMKGHATTIEREVRRMVADWGDEGEIDLLDFFAELTIYTSSACLIGKKFREQLDGRFARLYHQLEQGTDPLCYVDPYLPIESFRLRDEARLGLVELVQEIMNDRIVNPPRDKGDRDMLDVLVTIRDDEGNPRFSADEITGMFISMMFAGHHTSSGTASWTLIETAAPPRRVRRRGGRTRGALRRRPGSQFPCAAPDSEAGERAEGDAAAAPAADHPDAGGQGRVRGGGLSRSTRARWWRRRLRSPTGSPKTSRTRTVSYPDRYEKPRQEDLINRWTWIPFGAGRHRCVGAAFATMQIKAIFSVLLREYEFEMAQPSETYQQ